MTDELPNEEEARRAVEALRATPPDREDVLPGGVKNPRVFGQDRGLFQVPEDFDDPLPPEVLSGFGLGGAKPDPAHSAPVVELAVPDRPDRHERRDCRGLKIQNAQTKELNREMEDVQDYQAEP